MLPLMVGNEGDWLELVVADAVERALADAGANAVVRLNVEAHRDQRGRLDAEMPTSSIQPCALFFSRCGRE